MMRRAKNERRLLVTKYIDYEDELDKRQVAVENRANEDGII